MHSKLSVPLSPSMIMIYDFGLKGHQITDLLTHISQLCFCLQVWF